MGTIGGFKTAPKAGRHIIGMDGLRGLAAVTVLMVHTTHVLAPDVDYSVVESGVLALASHGLILFFALSGFLLFRPFAAAIVTSTPLPNVRRFLRNRFLRIYPAYVVILIVVALVFGTAYTRPIAESGRSDAEAGRVGYLTDPVLLALDASMLGNLFPSAMQTGLSVSWTLTVELAFYLALPLLALAAFKLALRSRRTVIWALLPSVILLVVGLAGKLILAANLNYRSDSELVFLQWGASWSAVFARSLLVHADLFAFGMVAAVIVSLHRDGRISPVWIQGCRWSGLVVGLLALAVTDDTAYSDTGWAVAFAAVILFVASSSTMGTPGVSARVLEWLPFRFVGVVSYSLYLWHLPVIWLLYKSDLRFPATPVGFWLNLAVVLAVGLALSALTYELIEKRALRFKKTTTPRSAPEAVERLGPE